MTIIELTPEDAQLFLAFREHQEKFAVLLSAGVFEMRNGKAILSFDPQGTLMDIDFEVKAYKRKKSPDSQLTSSSHVLH